MGSNNSNFESTTSTDDHSTLSQFSKLKQIQVNIEKPNHGIQKERRHKSKGIQNTCFLNSPKPRRYSFQQDSDSLWNQDKYVKINQLKQKEKLSQSSEIGFQLIDSPKLKRSSFNILNKKGKNIIKSQNQKLKQKFEEQQKTQLFQNLLENYQINLHQDLNRIDCYFAHDHSLDILQLKQSEEILSIEEWKVSVNKIINALQFLFTYQQGTLIICCKLRLVLTQKQTFYFMKLLLQKTSGIINAGNQYAEMMEEIQSNYGETTPQLKRIFDDNQLDLQYFAMKWVLSLFSIDFKLQFCLNFWKKLVLSQKDKVKEEFVLKLTRTLKIIQKTIIQKQWESDISFYLKNSQTPLLNYISFDQF